MLSFDFLVPDLAQSYLFFLNCQLNLIGLTKTLTELVCSLQNTIRDEFLHDFAFDLACSMWTLCVNVNYKFLHTNLKIFKALYLTLSQTHFYSLVLFLHKLSHRFLSFPNILLKLCLFDFFKFIFEISSV